MQVEVSGDDLILPLVERQSLKSNWISNFIIQGLLRK
jgi:hypothetical protein